MSRFNLYNAPHKALRCGLSQVSLLAGKTNYADLGEVEHLYKVAQDIFVFLTGHAADEDDFVSRLSR